MKKKLMLLILLFSSNYLYANIKNIQKNYCKMAYNRMDEFAKRMNETKDLHLQGRGGAMMHSIGELSLSFSTVKYLNINQARKLVVTTGQELINFFNCYPEIQPFLRDKPLTEKNIDLMISFRKGNERIHQDYIALVFTNNSKIFYCKYDKENDRFIDVLEETYSEALEKLADEAQF